MDAGVRRSADGFENIEGLVQSLCKQSCTVIREQRTLAQDQVCLLAWSVAVLQIREKDLVKSILDGLLDMLATMSQQDMRQVHLFLLSCILEDDLKELCGPDLDTVLKMDNGRCREAFAVRSQTHAVTSKLQRDVAASCRRLGLALTEEAIEEMTGYSVDIQLNSVPWKESEFPQGVPRSCAIEVDGPCHFLTDSREMRGRTVIKRRHFERLGICLISIPYWDWDNKSDEEHEALLRRLLDPFMDLSACEGGRRVREVDQ